LKDKSSRFFIFIQKLIFEIFFHNTCILIQVLQFNVEIRMQTIDLFFGLYILANIDDKTYKIHPKEAELIKFLFSKTYPAQAGCFIQERKTCNLITQYESFLSRGVKRERAQVKN